MKLYNTLSRSIEEFKPFQDNTVTLYTCGPTVYDYTHIGHMRKYTMDDLLQRTLVYLGYQVKHVMNITDVGHLASDADEGEDKLEKGAKKTGKTVWEVAQFYTDYFNKTMKAIHILPPDVVAKATDHIESMIKLIQKLEKKGYTYETTEAVYFDVTKFSDYGKLSRQKMEDKLIGARDDVHVDPHKKHPADFALWFKRVGRFADHTMHWKSPWGDGFPGWHIECSAMSMEYLGETIDIHTGGIDHIPVHHENEIAQSEGATGKQFVRFWVHHAFLNVEGEKMSKSKGNFLTIDDIEEKNIDPLALRYLFLQTHYRQEMNFTWDAVQGANEALNRLRDSTIELRLKIIEDKRTIYDKNNVVSLTNYYKDAFRNAISNDLNTSQALASVWEMLKANLPPQVKITLLENFDKVLGLKLPTGENDYKPIDIPREITALAEDRVTARINKDFGKSDELRQQIEQKGYIIEDTEEGYKIKKK